VFPVTSDCWICGEDGDDDIGDGAFGFGVSGVRQPGFGVALPGLNLPGL
jgi:hypothetical protein